MLCNTPGGCWCACSRARAPASCPIVASPPTLPSSSSSIRAHLLLNQQNWGCHRRSASRGTTLCASLPNTDAQAGSILPTKDTAGKWSFHRDWLITVYPSRWQLMTATRWGEGGSVYKFGGSVAWQDDTRTRTNSMCLLWADSWGEGRGEGMANTGTSSLVNLPGGGGTLQVSKTKHKFPVIDLV